MKTSLHGIVIVALTGTLLASCSDDATTGPDAGAISDTSSIHDSAIHDGAIHDGAIHDSAIHDGAIHDSAIHDSAIHDSAIHDSAIHDSTTPTPGKTLKDFYFVHHSVGSGIINDGDPRATIAAYNKAHSTSFGLWDQSAYDTDIINPQGKTVTNGGYNVPFGAFSTITPVDWKNIWKGSQSKFKTFRTQVLKDHEVIIFKNCFFVLDNGEHHLLKTAADLQGFKDDYLAMRTFFDTRKDRLFVVVTIPPTAYTATTVAEAKLARDFATWLCGPAYLSGHPNIVCWDLFDKLAVPEGQTHANTIRQSYWTNGDAHPNATANKMLAKDLANFLISAAESYKAP